MTALDPALRVTRFKAPWKSTTQGESQEVSWGRIVARVRIPHPWSGSKENAPAWAFADFEEDSRAKGKRVLQVHALVLDYDDEPEASPEAIRRWWGRWTYAAHTTASHLLEKKGKRHPRYRVIVPLAHPVTPEEAVDIGRWARHLNRAAGILGNEAEDPGRIYVEPLRTDGYQCDANEAENLDPRVALEELESWEWREPIPLREYTDLPAFPTRALPEWLAEFVGAVATQTQTPTDLPGLLSLGVLAIGAQGRARVQVRPGWTEPLSLFTAVALPPGNRKSAVFSLLLEPVHAWERERRRREQGPLAMETERRQIRTRRLAKAREKAASAAEEAARCDAEKEAGDIARELAEEPEPRERQLLAEDATPEALAGLMRDQGGRITLASAEGTPVELVSRYVDKGQSPRIELYNKAYDGEPIVVDRKGSPPIRVEHPALNFVLAVQPDVLRGFGARPEVVRRGLFARFAFALPVSPLGQRRIAPPAVPRSLMERYSEGVIRVLELPDYPHGSDPPCLRLSAGAAEVFTDAERTLEPRLGPGGDLSSIADWAAKSIGRAARIAAILHFAEHGSDGFRQEIGEDIAARALEIAAYLVPHAAAAYGLLGADSVATAAERLLGRLIDRGPQDFSVRDAHTWARGPGLQKAEDVKRALDRLEEHGYVLQGRTPPRTGPGQRPSPRYRLSPRARRTPRTESTESTESGFRAFCGFCAGEEPGGPDGH